jgi:hypothetical protein
MRLLVSYPDGELVAEVAVRHDSHWDPDGLSFILGEFAEGPGFARLRPMLDAFLATFNSGDLERAYELHEEIDRLGLVATDPAGKSYRLTNVIFQRGGLLFNAAP